MPEIIGVNTLLLSASATPIPDIVALAATPANDGIVNVPGAAGAGAFAVATVNVGASGNITASADTGNATLPVNISLCQTDPATGQCISAIGSSVTTTINANATPTFGVFVQGNDDVPFDPATNRIFVRFKDSGGGYPWLNERGCADALATRRAKVSCFENYSPQVLQSSQSKFSNSAPSAFMDTQTGAFAMNSSAMVLAIDAALGKRTLSRSESTVI